MAVNCFYALERKMAKDNTLKSEYTMFIDECESLRHMIETDPKICSQLLYTSSWCTEEEDVFKDQRVDLSCNTDTNSTVKMLGLVSSPKLSNFHQSQVPAIPRHTEGIVAYDVATTFDTMGLLAAAVVTEKICIQQLSKHYLSWDH
uniref:Uncharacterized protein n=1 Tax=Glossina pallidipes TaxID=7398 RepID=A0A1A9ZGG0_GLOPL